MSDPHCPPNPVFSENRSLFLPALSRHGLWLRFLAVCTLLLVSVFFLCAAEDTAGPADSARYEIFSTKIPAGANWTTDDRIVRDGGFSQEAENYIYVTPDRPAELTGLSIPIRENPGTGEYRYITFAWVKWGGSQIGMKFLTTDENPDGRGAAYDYTYTAGVPDPKNAKRIEKGLSAVDRVQGWVVVTRDLWKDFGDFTITGVQFICPERRDAGFDEIFLAKRERDLGGAPEILPSEAATPVTLTEARPPVGADAGAVPDTIEAGDVSSMAVKIDWGEQIRAGGFMMYPLYLLAFLAVVISIRRMMLSSEKTIAPDRLIREVNSALDAGDFERAGKACEGDASTLGLSLSWLLKHRDAGREAVSQSAGDIAARDIRTHLSRIYPISVISSLSPLLGLLGTVVGMIEAFGLVALYGDEGGASILSDSISKALITTAAGLIIAVPAVAAYYLLKNRIMGLASRVEAELEHVITVLYLESPGKGDGHAD